MRPGSQPTRVPAFLCPCPCLSPRPCVRPCVGFVGGGHGHSHGGHGHGPATPAPPTATDLTDLIVAEATATAFDVRAAPTQAPATAGSSSLNMKGVFLHVAGDALGSIVVMISALVNMYASSWPGAIYIDPALRYVPSHDSGRRPKQRSRRARAVALGWPV